VVLDQPEGGERLGLPCQCVYENGKPTVALSATGEARGESV
jgi:hypothetical protein